MAAHENVDFWSTADESHFMPAAGPIPTPASDSDASALFLQSSLREKVLEHLFIGELLRTLWIAGRRDIEVLRAEVDSSGYDVVLECNGVLRHVQLKSSHRHAKTRRVNVAVNLGNKPAGCVVWIEFDAQTLELGPFWWLGSKPNSALSIAGHRAARHTRAGLDGVRGERPGLRSISRANFSRVESMAGLIEILFG
jgi:hypothetical protein